MAKGIHRLAPRAIKTLPAGIHSDGGGLYLRVKASGARSWVLVYQWQGRRREKGLGSILGVDLDRARQRAEEARKLLAQGIDPAAANDAEVADRVTFGQAATDLVDSLEGAWRNAKHRAQWRGTLETHCKPIWSKPVDQVETADVLQVLQPIWSTTPETATRLRGRIERVLDAAKVKGQRSGENPARWRGHLAVILPPRKKKGAVKHHAAMPYPDVPEFVGKLKGRLSTAARALHFLILTAGRTGEVLGANWSEIDLKAKVWTVPADRMKMSVEHRVPLTPAAIAVLNAVAIHGTKPDAYVFPSQKPDSPLSNMSMLMLLGRMKIDDVTPHGFRSSFRDWAGEETDHPREVAEAALAHQVGNAVEAAYRRGDSLAKRRRLMEEWSDFVDG
jgi:integrase